MLIIAYGFTSFLWCQDPNPSAQDSIYTDSNVMNFLYSLYHNDIKAGAYITWESFTLNDIDRSGEYWESYDFDVDDLFIRDVIAEISTLLHYEGDANDSFTDLKITTLEDKTICECHNKQKKVILQFEPDKTDNYSLTNLKIEDYKK